MNTLSAFDLSFAYGSHSVLNAASFSGLQPGKLTALIGPNAAGKSTLFRLIAGLLTPVSGAVHLGGIDLSTLSQRDRLQRICYMPQYFAGNAAITVFEVVMMAHKQLRGWWVSDKDRDTIAHALKAGGIAHLADAYIGELSGGQAQMVSVVQALVRHSDVYLFDEPTSALDLQHQLGVLARIKSIISARNAIGLIAIHDLNLAARFADHILLLGAGEIQASGAPHDVLKSSKISEIYGVEVHVTTGPREELVVHAYPS